MSPECILYIQIEHPNLSLRCGFELGREEKEKVCVSIRQESELIRLGLVQVSHQ